MMKKSEQPLDTSEKAALYFFFQCLQEKLNDYSSDSYKAPALNTFSRTLELQRLAQRNFQANLGKETLKPFVEELEWSVDADPALSQSQRALCRVHLKGVAKDMDDPKRLALGLAGLRITLGDYLEAIKQGIRECILREHKQKSRLAELASCFIVQAELHGFPRRHTYHVVQIALRGPLRRRDYEVGVILEDLFRRFDLDSKTSYDCFMLVDIASRNYPKLLEAHGIELIDGTPGIASLNRRQLGLIASRKDSEAFALVSVKDSRCAVAANEICLSRFRAFSSKVSYVDHKIQLRTSGLTLVKNNETERIIIVRDSPDPMCCFWAAHASQESDALDLVKALSGSDFSGAATSRIERAIRYHAAALQTESIENKLVDLWAALEGLLSTPRKGVSRIDYFAESLLPSITLAYPHKILRSLYEQFTADQDLVDFLCSEVVEDGEGFKKFVRLMLCKEYKNQRDKCGELLTQNPLLLNRCWSVTNKFSSRKAVLETLQLHRRRVKWNLERIYAMRNSIMHDASALPHLPTLVENLHAYLDAFVRAILRVGAHALESKISIESALQYLSTWESYRIESLADKSLHPDEPLHEGNAWDSVFGVDLVISPEE